MCLGNVLSRGSVDKLQYDARDSGSLHGIDISTNCDILDQHQSADNDKFVPFKSLDNLNIMHLNIRSLPAKHTNLLDLLTWLDNVDIKIHVIALCETFINEFNIDYCQVFDYKLIHINKTLGKGGGVAFLIKKYIVFNQVTLCDSIDKTCENIHCEILYKNRKVLISEIYKPPSACQVDFESLYDQILIKAKKYDTHVICGDFNIDLLKVNINKISSDFLEKNMNAGFLPTILKPTRVTKSTCTLIDNIYIRDSNAKLVDPGNTSSAVITEDISDHFPCIVTIPNFLRNLDSKTKIYYRKYGNKELLLANHTLLHYNWFSEMSEHVDISYNNCIKKITNVLNEFMPIKSKTVNSTSLSNIPWYNKTINKCIKKSKLLYKKSIVNRDDVSITKYKTYRNSLNRIILFEKKKYFDTKFTEFKNNGNVTWSILNKLVKKCNDKSCIIGLLKKDSETITDPKEISSSFNKHFSDVSQRVKSTIPPTSSKYNQYLGKHTKAEEGYLMLSPTNDFEIDKLIGSLKKKTSFGHDQISNKLVIELATSLRFPLRLICNQSLEQGVFPDQMKIAKIKPLHKSGTITDVDNYQANITITSTFENPRESSIEAIEDPYEQG